MYLRLLIIIAVFNRPLAFAVAPGLLGLTGLGLLLAAGLYRVGPFMVAANSAASPRVSVDAGLSK